MPVLLSIPVLIFAFMLQTVVIPTLPLLNGYADLVMLVLIAWSLQERVRVSWIWSLFGGLLVGSVSAIPLLAPVVGYLVVTAISRSLLRWVWQIPILAMFLVTFLGSFICLGISFGTIVLSGASLSITDSLNLVFLPSVLLNILLALPVYAIITDLAQWVYPDEVEL